MPRGARRDRRLGNVHALQRLRRRRRGRCCGRRRVVEHDAQVLAVGGGLDAVRDRARQVHRHLGHERRPRAQADAHLRRPAPSPAVTAAAPPTTTLANSRTTRRRPSFVISLDRQRRQRPDAEQRHRRPGAEPRHAHVADDARPAGRADGARGAARSSRSASTMMRLRELFDPRPPRLRQPDVHARHAGAVRRRRAFDPHRRQRAARVGVKSDERAGRHHVAQLDDEGARVGLRRHVRPPGPTPRWSARRCVHRGATPTLRRTADSTPAPAPSGARTPAAAATAATSNHTRYPLIADPLPSDGAPFAPHAASRARADR